VSLYYVNLNKCGISIANPRLCATIPTTHWAFEGISTEEEEQ